MNMGKLRCSMKRLISDRTLLFIVLVFCTIFWVQITFHPISNVQLSIPESVVCIDKICPSNAPFVTPIRGLNVHLWYGDCLTTIESLCRFPLFPKAPFRREVVPTTNISRRKGNFGQRIFGFLHPPVTGEYQFAISSDDSSELWLSFNEEWRNSQLIARVGDKSTIGFTKRDVFNKYPTQISPNISLVRGQKYFIEIMHVDSGGANHVKVVWQRPDSSELRVIDGEHLSCKVQEDNMTVKYDISLHDGISCEDVIKMKNNVYMTPKEKQLYIDHRDVEKVLPVCDYEPSYLLQPGETFGQWDGIHEHLRLTWTFPFNGLKSIREKKNSDIQLRAVTFKKRHVYPVVMKYMQALNHVYPRKYIFKSVKNVELKENDKIGYRFLLELEMKRTKDNKIVILSEYVYQNFSNGQLCYPRGYQWNRNSTIYFLVTAKNLGTWVQHLINDFSRILEETRDPGIHLVIFHYHSPDINIEESLNRSSIPPTRYRVIKGSGDFVKTKAFNAAADSVSDPNAILFLLDLHLEISSNFIDSIRKHTIRGKLVYTPIITRLDCGMSAAVPGGYWEVDGFGLVAMYKSDWKQIGGFVKHRRGWGGEDYDIVDQVVKGRMDFERIFSPFVYHYHHSKRGMWH